MAVDKELIADQNRDIKQGIDDIHTDLFEMLGSEFSKIPKDPSAARTWLIVMTPKINNKALKLIDDKTPEMKRLVKSQVNNVASATIKVVDEDLAKDDKKPEIKKANTKVDAKLKTEGKLVGAVDDTMLRFANSIKKTFTVGFVGEAQAKIDKGKDPIEVIDTLIVEMAEKGLGNEVAEGNINTTPSSSFQAVLNDEILDMHTSVASERMLSAGEGVVKVSQHNDSAYLCSPFQGKVLALNDQVLERERRLGNKHLMKDIIAVDEKGVVTRVKPTIEAAKTWVKTKTGAGIGLFHKYCRHTFTYFTGEESSLEKPIPEKELEQKRKDRARGIDLEKKLNHWNRKSKAAISPQTKKTADDKLRLYRSQAREFTKETGLPVRGLKQDTSRLKIKDMESTIGKNNA